MTEPLKVFITGAEASLPCQYDQKTYLVRWKKEEDGDDKTLVTLDLHGNIGERSGLGYDEGRFNITENYSLVIQDIGHEDEGTYICAVTDGRVFRNTTIVKVIGELTKLINVLL